MFMQVSVLYKLFNKTQNRLLKKIIHKSYIILFTFITLKSNYDDMRTVPFIMHW